MYCSFDHVGWIGDIITVTFSFVMPSLCGEYVLVFRGYLDGKTDSEGVGNVVYGGR